MNKQKQYRLLKDLPGLKAGAIFDLHGLGLSATLTHGIHKISGFNFLDTDWFEPVEPERWKPKDGETYYFIYSHGEVQEWEWDGDYYDIERYKLGVCFQTEEQAKEASKRVKKTLLKYQKELMEEEK